MTTGEWFMKISIIIATLNAEALIQRAIVSVLMQTCPNYEIIVQDGASTDGTLEILKRFKGRVNWISEPDTGVYDAWNKALAKATGDWAIFLGADDFFLGNDVLARSSAYLKRLPPEVFFAYGALAVRNKDSLVYVIDRPLSQLYHMFLFNMSLPFSATFIRVNVLKEHGFDNSFKIAGDFDFAARLISPSNVARLPVGISAMELGGLSTNVKYRRTLHEERLRVLRTWIQPKAQDLVLALADAMEKEFLAQEP
jgi:glycosyltransferase involved in cell wall biosynthesis